MKDREKWLLDNSFIVSCLNSNRNHYQGTKVCHAMFYTLQIM